MMFILPHDISTVTLKQFFSISKKRINKERSECADRFDEIWQKIKDYLILPEEERTKPSACVECLHNWMILACSAQFDWRFPDSIAIQLASCAVSPIGDAAIITQTNAGSGQLRALNAEITTMGKTAGVEEREDPGDWPIEETRGEFESLMNRCGELIDKVRMTVMLDVLHRYKLDSIAALLEQDQDEFYRKAQEGSRILFPEAHAAIDEKVRKDLEGLEQSE